MNEHKHQKIVNMLKRRMLFYKRKAKKYEEQLNLAIHMLHGKCSACLHYSAYHRQGKCKNCIWDNANPACLREYQDDNWEWVSLTKK